ncbi:MAG: FkbM family methyltransferase [Alistipes sp.]|jgi:FkbM family methyltransferase|nr:FkbM family methyltransferase [Alistipes sp.]
MSITGSIKRVLYRTLPLEGYLRVLSAGFFAGLGLGLGRRDGGVYEYPRFLRRVARPGDVAIDMGANLGYYSRVLSRLVGSEGRVWAVEPVLPVLKVLRHNLRRCRNVEIVPCALGAENRTLTMVNDSARAAGYMGTGQNRVPEYGEARGGAGAMEFEVEMRRGSELFGGLERLDFIKCDIEGYERVVIPEMEAVILKHLPVVLIETGGANRRPMIELFREWGYAGYVLQRGRLVSVMRAPEKDIFFIPGHRHKELCE